MKNISGCWPSTSSQLVVMIGNMVDLLLLVFSVVVILLLSTALERVLALPFFHPPRHVVRDLLVDIQDLVLPMGSFPSKLLHPWAPAVDVCLSNSTALPFFPQPTAGEGGSKPNATLTSTEPTSDESGSKSAAVTPSTEPTSDDGGSKPTTNLSPTWPTPVKVGLNATTELPPTGPAPVDLGLDSTIVPTPAGPIPEHLQSVHSKDYPDNPLFDSLKYQLAPHDDTQIEESGVEVPLPNQQADEIDSLHSVSTVPGEGQQEQGHEESTSVVEDILAKTQAFEKAIRELVDPEGMYSPDLQETIELVSNIMKQQAEVVNRSRSERVRFQRAEEDLRHGWEDMREVFERIISGQNAMLQLTQERNDGLVEENATLLRDNTGSKEKYQRMLTQYNNHLRTLNAAKDSAEQAAETATAGVEGRIEAVQKKYEKEKKAAELSSWQKQNALICSRRMVEDSFVNTRNQQTVVAQQHEAAMKSKDSTISGLEATIRDLRSTAEMPEELAASAKRILGKQLEDLRQEKDSQISTLRDQLRESKEAVRTLSGWKATAEGEQQNSQRLSTRLEEVSTTLREDKKHVVDGLKLDIKGLQETVRTNEATINQLEGRITELESGDEVQDLKSKFRKCKRQLQQSAKESQEMKKQLEDKKREEENLQGSIKTREEKINEEAETSSKEKESLKKQLEQATRAPDKGLEEQARKLEEQNKELSRNLETTRDAEQEARTEMQRLKNEDERRMTEHQKAMKGKDEEIHRLGQAVQHASEAADAKANEAGNEANKLDAGKARRHEEAKEEAVNCAIKKAAEEAEKKEQQYVKDKKEAVETAVQKAAEDVRQTYQRQLDDESKSSREARDKATKTESDLRTEMSALKSRVEKAAESKSADLADPQPGKDTKELTVLATEVAETNNLLLEIARNGVIQGSTEHAVLHELNSAKLAVYRVNRELRKPQGIAKKNHLVSIMYGVKVNEEHIQQLDITTQAVLVRQAKVTNARLTNLQNILGSSDDVQQDAMLEAISAPNPLFREVKKPRSLKRNTQPGPSNLPLISSTGVHAGSSVGQSQQTNETPKQQSDPPSLILQQNVQPQLPAATSQEQTQGLALARFDGAAYGSTSHTQVKATPDSTSAQGAPVFADDGSSSLTPPSQGDHLNGTPSFDFGAIDKSNPIWKGIDFSKRNDVPEEAKKDRRQPFADILAALRSPTSSEKAATANVPEPTVGNKNNSTTGPASSPAKTPQRFSVGDTSRHSGLQDDTGNTQAVSIDPSERPINKMRGRSPVNASKGRQLAHKAFTSRNSSPGSTPGQQSGSQQQGIDTKQGGSGDISEQDHRPDQPKGWTDLLTNIVMKQLRHNSDTELGYVGNFLRWNHEFETNDIQCLNKYLEKLRQEVKAEQGHRSDQPKGYENVSAIEGVEKNLEKLKNEHEGRIPEMPSGWTDEMTGMVWDGLQHDDDIDFIEINVKEQLGFQTNDDKGFQEWLKKLQEDYKTGVEDPIFADAPRNA